MKISVIVPCYSTPQIAARVAEQLWYSVCSAYSALENDGADFEIIPVMNGVYPLPATFDHSGGRIRTMYCGASVDSPQAARDAGFRNSTGELVFFLDAHVVVPPNFFSTIIADMKASGADFMGTPHRWLGPTYYGCKVAWHEYMWCRDVVREPPNGNAPWRTAVHPHGAFCVRRKSYERAGGYWKALKGYGGEETQLCFKFWMLGMSVWVTPKTYHWHFLQQGDRRTEEIFSNENFARNFMLIAATYGGEERAKKSYEAFRALHWNMTDKFPGMLHEVLASKELHVERAILKEAKYHNIDELRDFFRSEGILE